MPKPKIGLALGAGGARGFCHIGVLKVFAQFGLKPDVITGSSMGAIAGGFYAAGIPIEEMEAGAEKITQSALMDFDVMFIRKLGLLRGDKAEKILTRYVGEVNIDELSIPYAAIATDLIAGETCVLDKGGLVTAMRASMTIPGVFAPVELEDKMLIDGGVLCRLPIAQAYRMGADIVIAVDALGPLRVGERPKRFVSLVERTYAVMDWHRTQGLVSKADYLITPDMGDKNEFVFKENHVAIEAGEAAALKAMPQLMELITNHRPRAKTKKI